MVHVMYCSPGGDLVGAPRWKYRDGRPRRPDPERDVGKSQVPRLGGGWSASRARESAEGGGARRGDQSAQGLGSRLKTPRQGSTRGRLGGNGSELDISNGANWLSFHARSGLGWVDE